MNDLIHTAVDSLKTPLVVHARTIHLVCHLDILFLRYDEPGQIFTGGDLDGRIKVWFDALSVPQRINGELGEWRRPDFRIARR